MNIITDEVIAGASGLDGEELTLALLHENEVLAAENKRLSRKQRFRFWLLVLAWFALAAMLVAQQVKP